MTHSCVIIIATRLTQTWHDLTNSYVIIIASHDVIHSYVIIIAARDMTHSCVRIGATRDMTHSCVIIIATRLTHTWHNSFMCDSHCHSISSEKTPGNIRDIFAKEPNKHRVLFQKRSTSQENQQIVATQFLCIQHRDSVSCPIWMSHVPYEWVLFHMNESCPILMSHVLYEWVRNSVLQLFLTQESYENRILLSKTP